jgi:hypothetical protein
MVHVQPTMASTPSHPDDGQIQSGGKTASRILATPEF